MLNLFNLLVVTELTMQPERQPVVVKVQHRNVQEVGDKLREAWSLNDFSLEGRFRKVKDFCCIKLEKELFHLSFCCQFKLVSVD